MPKVLQQGKGDLFLHVLHDGHIARNRKEIDLHLIEITTAEDVATFPSKLDRTLLGKSVPVSSCADSWTSLSDLRFEERGPGNPVLRL